MKTLFKKFQLDFVKKRIVIIDNDSRHLDSLERVIKEIDKSFHCLSFIFADEALQVISCELSEPPVIIFINVNLNRKSGTTCLSDLRKNMAFDNSQIIMFSVVMPTTVEHSFIRMGADGAFQKPVSTIEYKNILRPILNRHRI